MNISVINEPDQALINFLDQKIVEFNHAHRELNDRFPIAVVMKNDLGEVIAGAAGQTFGDWLQLDTLWVSEESRGQDYGTKILIQIEQAAKARSCKQCLLNTLNFQAMPFYLKHGYQVQWTQQNYPKTGCKYYMSKTL